MIDASNVKRLGLVWSYEAGEGEATRKRRRERTGVCADRFRWRVPVGNSRYGGAVTTASNLVFQVAPDGRVIAYSADKGEKLFEASTGMRNGMGPPITFAVDGKQYIALMGGSGGTEGYLRNDVPDCVSAIALQKLVIDDGQKF